MLGEDREPCGFDGKPVEVPLYDRGGALTTRLRMQNGKVMVASEFDRAGRLTASSEATADGRITRRFHDNGQRAAETVVAHDLVVAEREWYMNGQPKTRVEREAVERNPKSTVERFRDDGVIASRSEELGRRTLHQATYDERGRPKEEFDYDDDGRVRRHRAYGPDGALTVDEALYPDGSRKSLLATPKVAR
jgi:YD repeat-containing protein